MIMWAVDIDSCVSKWIQSGPLFEVSVGAHASDVDGNPTIRKVVKN